MSDFWRDKRVLVTGGAGFLGSFIVDRLRAGGAQVALPRSKEYDLRRRDDVDRMLDVYNPSVVIHAAVDGGGIGYMRHFPGSVYTNNTLMNTLLLDGCYRAGVAKFVGVSSVCAYPRDAPVPMREEDLWDGYPEPTNAAYGLSKKMMMEQGKAYKQQYGYTSVFPMPVNLYGPRDHFDPERSHVVPALIRKCVEAREAGADHIVAWGTGKATRELLYVEDCADAVLRAAEVFDRPDPINIGTGRETPVKELVETVAAVCGFEGEIRWDTSKPDGQPRKCLDVSRARDWLGWEASVSLEEGLKRTVEWYLSRR